MSYINLIDHVISADETGNSTKVMLGIGGTFTGNWENVEKWSSASIAIYSDDVTSGTLWIDVSHDDGHTIVNSVPLVVEDTNFNIPKVWNIVEKWFRIRYINGGTAHTSNFAIQTKYSNAQSPVMLQQANDTITGESDVQLVKSVNTGVNKAGNYKNSPVDSEGHMFVNIHDPKSAFGHVKTIEETLLVGVKFPYTINSKVIGTTVANGGTVTQSNAMMVLQTSADPAGSAIAYTKENASYQTGFGLVCRFTAIFTTGVANSKQYVGYGDDQDGIFFGYNGVNFGFLHRNAGVETFTAKTTFNVDRFDGSLGEYNPTGATLDSTKMNVYQIKMQWLGGGTIVLSIEDEEDGIIEPAHLIKYPNNYTAPSLDQPNLPIRWEITNTGNASNLTLKCSSAAVILEGKKSYNNALQFSHSKAASTSTPHVFSIRNKATYAGKTNRIPVIIEVFSYANDGASTTTYTLTKNATLAGGAWVDVDASDSCVEYNDTATISIAGTQILPFNAIKGTGATVDLFSKRIILFPGDILTVRSSNGNSSDVSLVWLEDI